MTVAGTGVAESSKSQLTKDIIKLAAMTRQHRPTKPNTSPFAIKSNTAPMATNTTTTKAQMAAMIAVTVAPIPDREMVVRVAQMAGKPRNPITPPRPTAIPRDM